VRFLFLQGRGLCADARAEPVLESADVLATGLAGVLANLAGVLANLAGVLANLADVLADLVLFIIRINFFRQFFLV